MDAVWLGVDVGTGSVRAALFDNRGRQLTSEVVPISVVNLGGHYYQQSSVEIWEAVTKATKSVTQKSPVSPNLVAGIGFDATCSLVILDKKGSPLVFTDPKDDKILDIIMWMDHRAVAQAQRLEEILDTVVSPEMQLPKALWLKENSANAWENIGYIIDLPDFLTMKATGSNVRSVCSLVCKWKYDAQKGWDEQLLKKIVLDINKNNFEMVGGTSPLCPGQPVGAGLTAKAAAELGLTPGITVATSIIDAYAGALGALSLQSVDPIPLVNRLAIISGTSACHLAISDRRLMVPGVWGPYLNVMLPDKWINEAGQSAAGSLLDHIVQNHPAYKKIESQVTKDRTPYSAILHDRLKALAGKNACQVHVLTKNFHVYPDFHGNRSPLADPHIKGCLLGLSLSAGLDDLAILYLAAVQALALSTKHIIEQLEKHGHKFHQIHLCGGLAMNELYLQTHADVTGLNILTSKSQDPVLLGCAVLAATASGHLGSLTDSMVALGGAAHTTKPDFSTKVYYDAKYRVYLKMLQDQFDYRNIMTSAK